MSPWLKPASLVAQAFHGIELGGASSGHCPEDDADQRRDHDGDNRRPARDGDAVVGQKAYGIGQGEADDDSGDASDERDQDRLSQKLKADFAVGGSDSLAHTDLADARGYGGQHDVHDADAAYRTRHRRK